MNCPVFYNLLIPSLSKTLYLKKKSVSCDNIPVQSCPLPSFLVFLIDPQHHFYIWATICLTMNRPYDQFILLKTCHYTFFWSLVRLVNYQKNCSVLLKSVFSFFSIYIINMSTACFSIII